VFVRHVGPKEIRSDIEIVDSLGRLHYRFEGWEDVRILLPESLWRLRIAPRDSHVATQWPDPVRELKEKQVTCTRVDIPAQIFEVSHGIWLKVVAHIVLSAKERQEFARLKVPKRQHEWLRGRCAVKDAVRMLVRKRLGQQLAPAEIETGHDGSGRPTVTGAWLTQKDQAPAVSLSHTSGRAVAIACYDANALVGIDVESVSGHSPSLQSEVFTLDEQSLLACLPAETQQEWAIRLWSAKETVGKALGTGMSPGLHAFRITKIYPEHGALDVQLREGLTGSFPDLENVAIRVDTCSDQNFICSTALIERRLM
jgi:phosphopantetheine--protein transferase-like protein